MKHIILATVLFASAVIASAQNNTTHQYSEAKDVLWASPKGYDLTMDIYTPQTNKSSYPVLIIYHGGGWLINNKSIMDEMSQYIASHSEYVVCNVNYRLLTANDNTTHMNEIIEDAMGAVLWTKEHISKYKGNPNEVAVTGDSAGGHLAAMVVNAKDNISEKGFSEGVLSFTPTYIPTNKTIADIKADNSLEVQAAILSYPAVDIYTAAVGDGVNGFESDTNFFWQMGGAKARGIFGENINAKDNPEYYKTCSPIYTVSQNSERAFPPQFCHVGSKDATTTPTSIQAYVDKLNENNQPVEFWIYKGRNHAYLDSGSNEFLGNSFDKDAIEPIHKIISFLDGIFYTE
ncbi:alpha/beta hydrolase [Joostella sp. CR20]|uniref:alpha/beta hydrolase n=1 Tax=Joostella sp. CR20 TaxID=2804312 RepID=UPI00313F1A24